MKRTIYSDTYPCVPYASRFEMHNIVQTIGNSFYKMAKYIYENKDIEIWNTSVERLTFSNSYTIDKEAKCLLLNGHAFGVKTIMYWYQTDHDEYFVMVHYHKSSYAKNRHIVHKLKPKDFDRRMIRDTDHPDIIISLSDTKDLGSPDEPESWHGFWNATLDIEDYLHNRLEEAIVEHREKTSDASS